MNPTLFCVLAWLIWCPQVFARQSREATFDEFESDKKKYAQDLYDLAIGKSDSLLLAEAYYLKAKQAIPIDLKKAMELFLKSLEILEPRGPSFELGRLYVRLGEMAETTQNTALGQAYFAKAREVFLLVKSERAFKTWPHLFRDYRPLSIWIKNPEELDKLLAARLRVEALARLENNSKDDTARNNLEMAVAFWARQKADTRFWYLNSLWELAGCYIQMQDYARAKQTLDTSEKIGKEAHLENNKFYRPKHLSTWYEYYKAVHNWEKAHGLLLELKTLEGKKAKEEGMAQLRKLEMEYGNEKKDNLIKIKESEVSAQKRLVSLQQKYLAGAGALIMLLVVLGGYLYRLFKVNKRISELNRRLLREQNHRINNNLSAVSSLIRLQSHEVSDPMAAGLMEKSRLRIAAIARLHKKLYTTHELSRVFVPDFLEEIVTDVLDAFGLANISKELTMDPVYLSAPNAMHLGLICNEVVTNACKYALTGHPEPRLRLSLKHEKDVYYLEITDNGLNTSPLPAKKKSSFGMGLIEVEAEELRGKFRFIYRDGLQFSLRFSGKPEKEPAYL